MDACTNPDILKVIYFFQLMLDIVKIIIPIGLIIMGMIDFSKSVITNDESAQKKNVSIFIKRIIYAVLIFIVPWIVEVIMIWLGNITEKVNFTDCLENTEYIEHYENLNINKEEQNTTTSIKEISEANKSEDFSIKDNKKEGTSTNGTFIGQRYNLSETQLKEIASLCQAEQGSAKGAAAEASLIANLFELKGSSYGEGADGLYNYVANSGWFAYAKKHMQQTNTLRNDVYTAVHDVLKLGKRTLPLYIDEHDCIDCGSYGFDVVKLVIGDKTITDKTELKNKENYITDKTIIYNKYSSIYTFYTFPTSTSDPFGYTEYAYNKYNSLKKE